MRRAARLGHCDEQPGSRSNGIKHAVWPPKHHITHVRSVNVGLSRFWGALSETILSVLLSDSDLRNTEFVHTNASRAHA